MTTDLQQTLAALRAVAPRLNAATASAARAYQAVEALLQQNGVSVFAVAGHRPIQQSKRDDGLIRCIQERLAYARSGGIFRICLETKVYDRDPKKNWYTHGTGTTDYTPWSSWDRATKLEWVKDLPELLGELARSVEWLAMQAEDGATTVHDLLNELEGDGELAPPVLQERAAIKPSKNSSLQPRARYKEGFSDGQDWADQAKSTDPLERLEAVWNRLSREEWEWCWIGSDCPGAAFVTAVFPDGEAGDNEVNDFWREIGGPYHKQIAGDGDYVLGFGNGALATWAAVKAKL